MQDHAITGQKKGDRSNISTHTLPIAASKPGVATCDTSLRPLFKLVFFHSPHKDLDSCLSSQICNIEMVEASFVFLGQMRTGL